MKKILDRHNQYRCMHGVPPLKWSDTIAANALAYAKSVGGQMKHSSSSSRRGIGGFSYLGENLAKGSYDLNEKAVDMWYNEINLTPGKKGLVSAFSSGTGHYTQVVWKATTALGCGIYNKLVNCQYGVGGNMGGQFTQNVPAVQKSKSQCPEGGGASPSPSPTPTPRPTPTPPTPRPSPPPSSQCLKGQYSYCDRGAACCSGMICYKYPGNGRQAAWRNRGICVKQSICSHSYHRNNEGCKNGGVRSLGGGSPSPSPGPSPSGPAPSGTGPWKKGWSTRYGKASGYPCNSGPCYSSVGKPSSRQMSFFESGGILYGTAASGVKKWDKCGTCYEMKIMSQCASIHGGYGCDQNRNRKILGAERKAIVMAANECPECKEGHFDFCMDENWGGTVLGTHGGIDNPALMYREVPCPKVLTDRLKR